MSTQWINRIMETAALRGVSGREHQAAKALCEQLKQFAPDAVCRDGSVIGHIGAGEGKPRLMLCAHLDQVGFFVTDITKEGFLRIGAVGGPRCCKRNGYLAMEEAVAFVKENLGVCMELEELRCTRSQRNNQCKGTDCPFHV